MLTTLTNRRSQFYTKQEKGANLFITFLFVLFFFQFFRSFIIEIPVNRQLIVIQTVLVLLWYGLTLMVN